MKSLTRINNNNIKRHTHSSALRKPFITGAMNTHTHIPQKKDTPKLMRKINIGHSYILLVPGIESESIGLAWQYGQNPLLR